MPAKHIDLDAVRDALVADGWTITDDPLRVQFGGRDLYIDLGAEQSTLTAEKADRRIAVEVQTFANPSDVKNLQDAVGQYGMYRVLLRLTDPALAVHGRRRRRVRWDPVRTARPDDARRVRNPDLDPRPRCEACRPMDTLTDYRETLRRVLREYADWSGGNGITAEVIEDPTRDHFELIRCDCDGHRRVHGTILHVDIIGGKLWIQHDGTNRPLAEELAAAGVPKKDIVLAYKPPRLRPHTGYGVG